MAEKKKIVAVIPARYESSRLPGKPLIKLGDKTIIERVYEQVFKSQLVDEVVIATDDERILEHAKSFGARAEMTSTEHKSGTDRIAELAAKNLDWHVIINVQGDEPFIKPEDIDKAIEPFKYDPTIEMTSLYHDFDDIDDVANTNNVKVVTDINGMALYFSRSPIPLIRDKINEDGMWEMDVDPELFKKHLGLYGYRRDVLLAVAKLDQSDYEQLEKLEQLRALENGISIKMIKVAKSNSIGIDTQSDLEKAEELLA